MMLVILFLIAQNCPLVYIEMITVFHFRTPHFSLKMLIWGPHHHTLSRHHFQFTINLLSKIKKRPPHPIETKIIIKVGKRFISIIWITHNMSQPQLKLLLQPKNNSFFFFGFQNYVNLTLTDPSFKFWF